jgi:predicted RNA binding protein YcfA (HicA-like mRNA interferase family)
VKRQAKELIEALERLGYEYDRTNSKGFLMYVHADGDEVGVSEGIQEHAARQLLRKVERRLGVERDTGKRNAAGIKERQAYLRMRLAEDIARHREELDAILARKSQRLDGLGLVATEAEIARITRYIEQRERELADMERLMRGAPLTDNRAKHRA